MLEDPDRPLYDAWRSGDARAGNSLFARHFDDLYGFFRHKVGEAVEDLLQQTMLQCVRSADRFHGHGSFRAFLFGIASNVLKTHLRGKYRQEKRQDSDKDWLELTLEELSTSPLLMLAEREEVRVFARALRRIPIDFQILFELHYWQKLPAPALAQMQDVPEGTIRSRLRRAKELLREQIAELASSPHVLASTLSGFETWAERVRASAYRDKPVN